MGRRINAAFLYGYTGLWRVASRFATLVSFIRLLGRILQLDFAFFDFAKKMILNLVQL